MHILVDYRPALRASTGVGVFMHGLVRAYTAVYDDDVAVFTSSWRDRPSPAIGADLRARVVDRRVPVRALNLLWHRLEWPPVEALAGPCDVAHAAHPLLLPARRAAQVITIHDLFFLSNPERTHGEIRRDYPALAPAHARRADAIVTPSHHVKAQIVARLGVDADRVYVCSPGAPSWRTLGRTLPLSAAGYILFVGTLEARKNVGVLLDAYERLIARVPDAPRLVLAGGATADAEGWLSRIGKDTLHGRITHLGYVPNDEREGVYAGAYALVLPSLDEGFGLPVLEAMSAGVPVIASSRGSLPEVLGAAGTLVDPHDVEGWASALERLITDPDTAARHQRAGLERAREFTWERAARTLHTAYVDAVERRRAR